MNAATSVLSSAERERLLAILGQLVGARVDLFTRYDGTRRRQFEAQVHVAMAWDDLRRAVRDIVRDRSAQLTSKDDAEVSPDGPA